MLSIGSLVLDVPFFQAPLSGYSDYAMRRLALDFGAPLVFAGVVLAKSAAHPKVISKASFRPREDEHPVGAQILGREPEIMAKAAKELAGLGYDLIDLNFACPAPKVLRRQRGGFMLNEPGLVIEIVRRVREAVSCPLLIKLRTGVDDSEESKDNFWQIAQRAGEEGVDAIVVHGRTVEKRYHGTADWEILGEVKQQLPHTVIIGSGDVFSAGDVVRMLETTKVDGVVIARGAIGNPWIFREARAYFEGKPAPAKPTLREQAQVILKHIALVSELYRKAKTVRYLRKFLVNYCKHHPERRKAQKNLVAAESKMELLACISEWYGVETVSI
jgi:tRNA-dihydrouridine synthase B